MLVDTPVRPAQEVVVACPNSLDPVSAATPDPGLDRLKAVLDGWRNSLLDMGGRNRLLNFRHTRTATLEITAPDPAALLAELAKGWDFAPVTERETGVELAKAGDVGTGRRSRPGLVTQKTTQAALDGSLYQLRQKSGQMYNDYGLVGALARGRHARLARARRP